MAFVGQCAWAQLPDSLQVIFDRAVELASTTSIKRNTVNWEQMRKDMLAQVDTPKDREDVVTMIQYMLGQLDDYHGRVWYDKLPYYGAYRSWNPGEIEVPDSLLEAFREGTPEIRTSIVDKKYGYLFVPGTIDSTFGYRLRDSICAMNPRKIKGWIIDLRLNGGGNMFFQLSGLAALIGEGSFGAFWDPVTQSSAPWEIRQSNVYIYGEQRTFLPPLSKSCRPQAEYPPVVMLTSSYTLSSGEVIVIAGKGRPHCRILGEPTGGYTTTTSWEPLSDDMTLQLTVSYYADRQGTVYAGVPVQPDQYIGKGDHFADPEKDQKVRQAIQWLKKQ